MGFIEGIIPPRTFTKTHFCTFIVFGEQSVSGYSINSATAAITTCVVLHELRKILNAECTLKRLE